MALYACRAIRIASSLFSNRCATCTLEKMLVNGPKLPSDFRSTNYKITPSKCGRELVLTNAFKLQKKLVNAACVCDLVLFVKSTIFSKKNERKTMIRPFYEKNEILQKKKKKPVKWSSWPRWKLRDQRPIAHTYYIHHVFF